MAKKARRRPARRNWKHRDLRTVIDVATLEGNLDWFVARAKRGTEIVVTEQGLPFALLQPFKRIRGKRSAGV